MKKLWILLLIPLSVVAGINLAHDPEVDPRTAAVLGIALALFGSVFSIYTLTNEIRRERER